MRGNRNRLIEREEAEYLKDAEAEAAGHVRPSFAILRRFFTPRRLLITAVLLAAALRMWALLLLPTDSDEPVYLKAAFDYARLIRAGDWGGLLNYDYNLEHPPLVKLMYAGVILALGEDVTLERALVATRALSAVMGTLTVLLVGLAGGAPAAVLLAVNTLTVKYTSQAYLEAWPLLTSLVTVLAFVRVRARAAGDGRNPGAWFWLSAVGLGLTAAGKFTYLPAVIVTVVYLAAREKNLPWRAMALYLALGAAVFALLAPSYWPAPVARLAGAVYFHVHYTQAAMEVARAAYPWYQPLIWLSTSPPVDWHPEVFFYAGLDGPIFLLALGGLQREWRERRWLVVWLAAGLLVVLAWPTKWPQYSVMLAPPVCVMAGATARRIYHWLRDQEAYYEWLPQMIPPMPRSTWVVTALALLFVGGVYVWGALGVALGSIGWSHLTPGNALLPSATIFAVEPLADGRVALGTGAGAALWLPPAASDTPNVPVIFNTGNSGLPDNRVLAVSAGPDGRLWFGTASGVAVFDGAGWETYDAGDMGLAGGQTHALVFDASGRLYAGTESGVAVWADNTWTTFTPANSGLDDARVFSAAVTAGEGGEAVWFGTLTGLNRLVLATGAWQSFEAADTGLGAGGIADLLVDSRGWLWVASQGGGLARWDGQTWEAYRMSNSDLPYSVVNVVAEVAPGLIWVGTSEPTDVGGAVATFDGERWRTYRPANSGFSGAEPLAIARDRFGRVWVGTRTAGVDLFELREAGR